MLLGLAPVWQRCLERSALPSHFFAIRHLPRTRGLEPATKAVQHVVDAVVLVPCQGCVKIAQQGVNPALISCSASLTESMTDLLMLALLGLCLAGLVLLAAGLNRR